MISVSKNQLIIISAVGVLIVGVIGYYIYTMTTNSDYEPIEEISQETNIIEEQAQEETEEIIVVHIAGQVKNPGIVRIQDGGRIADIIEKAGGLTEQADITNVNLAYIIEDGQKITIPSKADSTQEEYITTQNGDNVIDEDYQIEKGGNTMVNINKASQEELQQLQGIGEATAIKIIEFRKQNGEFKQIEDIKNVPGIGDAKFENIKNNICVK